MKREALLNGMNGLLDYAEQKLDEAIKNNEPAYDVNYWHGYMGGVNACIKILGKAVTLEGNG